MDQNELTKLVADNVRRILAERGWTQTDLANKLGWSTGNLSRLMTLKRTPGADVLAQLVTALECSPCDLVTIIEKPARKKSR